MPCTDGGVPYPPSREQVLDDKCPQFLCAFLRLFPDVEVQRMARLRVDWKEAGVKAAEFNEWWVMHKKRDAARQAVDAQTKQQETIKKTALSKLTNQERIALGLYLKD